VQKILKKICKRKDRGEKITLRGGDGGLPSHWEGDLGEKLIRRKGKREAFFLKNCQKVIFSIFDEGRKAADKEGLMRLYICGGDRLGNRECPKRVNEQMKEPVKKGGDKTERERGGSPA